jgi:hypothetical protein
MIALLDDDHGHAVSARIGLTNIAAWRDVIRDMRIRALAGLMWIAACRGDSTAPPPPATETAAKIAPPDAAPAAAPADAGGVDAPLQITASPPPELHCPPPKPAVEADLKRKILHELALARSPTPQQITPICEERAGWLVSVVSPDDLAGGSPPPSQLDAGGQIHTMWLVKNRERPVWLEHWVAGPIYDFDGDGTPEASTLAGSELKIWFDGGRKPSYTLVTRRDPREPLSPWAALDHQVVWLEHDDRGIHVFEFHPGQAHHELPRATCVQLKGPDVGCADPPAPPAQAPPSQDKAALQIARVLTRRASSARCAQPDDALRAQPEAFIEQAVLREIDDHLMLRAGGPLHFTWGCTSHDETPVVVDVVQDNGGIGSELWSVRGDKATRRRSYWSGPPDEWTSTHQIAIGGHGDFDGDGFDESIIEEQSRGYVQATVHLGGADLVVPSHLVLRAADGKRDGIVRLRPFAVPAPAPAPCKPITPDACRPGPPPAGWLPMDPDGSWDWEHQPPQVLVWRGARFVPLADAAVAAITAETAAERAAVK